jgi:hypothetical protein
LHDLPTGMFYWLGLIGFLVLVFALPTVIALIRRTEDLGTIILLNLVVIGVPIGLPVLIVMACIWTRRERPVPYASGPPTPRRLADPREAPPTGTVIPGSVLARTDREPGRRGGLGRARPR